MIGAIIGDIVGSRFERKNLKSKDFMLFTLKSKPTDDSIQSLAIAKALLECDGNYDDLSEKAIGQLQYWGRKYPKAGYGTATQAWIKSNDPEPYNSNRNGAAMRVSPCGHAARNLDEAFALADKVTVITHSHPEGIKGAKAVTAAVYLALHDGTKKEIRDYISRNFYPLDFTLDEIRDRYSMDVTCEGSVPQAIEAFLESKNFEDAIRNAVSIGGDSDTIAAIAGSIAEAYYGVPDDFREEAVSYFDSKPGLLTILNDFEAKYGTVPYKTEKNGITEAPKIMNRITDSGFVFFWREYEVNGYLSQWYPISFVIDGIKYQTAEQYMMAQKAMMAGDNETLNTIMRTKSPKKCKKLGRNIIGFDSDKWDVIKEDVVYRANIAKFSQNEALKQAILETGNAILAEANQYDSVWGIGRKASEKAAQVPEKWKGSNLLGKALMKVRDELSKERQ